MPHAVETSQAEKKWWQTASIYQIYPSSFKDSNSDGLGDIPGIISKVDYLKSLNVDAVWLSPVYKSPQVDMGYDISDYRVIHEPYGTVQDIETLIAKLGERGMKLIMDLVINHTSDQHRWFQESRSGIDSPKRDWYIWRKGKVDPKTGERSPPNNWESLFKGSAWEYDEASDEYYLHLFAIQQPDLNWENPEVRTAVHADMHFWLEKGIGGFREDVINMISKHPELPDAPITQPDSPYQPAPMLYCNGPRMHEYLHEIRTQVLDEYPDLMTVGEVPFTRDTPTILDYVTPSRRELDMIFQFDIFDIDTGPNGKFSSGPWTVRDIKHIINKYQTGLGYAQGGWQTVFLESHDTARSVSRFGDNTPANRPKTAKMFAMMETTLAGTLFMHQGQEIGTVNYHDDVPISEYADIETRNYLNAILATHPSDEELEEVYREIRIKARDHGRMPVQWEGTSLNAGFSPDPNTKPWAPVNTDYKEWNVANQDKDEGSVLNFWRGMLKFRKANPGPLTYGSFELVDADHDDVFAYRRVAEDGETMLVVLNFSPKQMEWVVRGVDEKARLEVLKSTTGKATSLRVGETVRFDPYEGVIWRAGARVTGSL